MIAFVNSKNPFSGLSDKIRRVRRVRRPGISEVTKSAPFLDRYELMGIGGLGGCVAPDVFVASPTKRRRFRVCDRRLHRWNHDGQTEGGTKIWGDG